jgi:glutamate carboxypeptidase
MGATGPCRSSAGNPTHAPFLTHASAGANTNALMTKKRTVTSSLKSATNSSAQTRLHYFEQRRDQIVDMIRRLVEIESPSDNKQAVDRCSAFAAEEFATLGGRAQFHRVSDFGNHLQVDFPGETQQKPVLLLGHYDTVYPLGTLATMPCHLGNGKLWGPGVLDMKSGIAMMLYALQGLQSWHGQLPRPVTVLLVSDEEIGSDTSRHLTEELAQQSSAVLVLEPSYGSKGAVKTARKGVGEYSMKITGVAAHSGLDFEKGQSAILELAKQTLAISKMVNVKRGLTLNVGVIQGGTRTNVIASEATAALDVRVARMKDASVIDKKLRALRPFNRKCKLEITGGVNRPPMERTPGVAMLYSKAALLARQLGWTLTEAAVGGGSDGNFTAGLGIPTLDGLGGVGDGAHAVHEAITIAELPRRTALLAGLIESV